MLEIAFASDKERPIRRVERSTTWQKENLCCPLSGCEHRLFKLWPVTSVPELSQLTNIHAFPSGAWT